MNSELEKLIEDSFGLLRKVLVESSKVKGEPDYRMAFICRHTRSIYRLGQDIMFLLKANRLDSCPIIVRAMLESLFKLVAAVIKPETAVQIFISEIEGELKWMKKRLDPKGKDVALTIEQVSVFAEKLRREHGVTSKKKWNTLACAEAAELGQTYYLDEYFVFSKHAHAMTSGIMLRENKIGAGHVLQTLLFIVPYSAGRFAEANLSQSDINEAGRLMQELTKLAAKGIFSEMDRSSKVNSGCKQSPN